jgi:hypothetical protein
MDSSTTEQCSHLEDHIGSAEVGLFPLQILHQKDYCRISPRAKCLFLALQAILQKLAELTGSRAFHRFSGAQIAKIYHQKPQVYKLTEVQF